MSGQWPPEWEDPDDGHLDDGLPDERHSDAGHSELELAAVTSFLASVHSPALPASFEARINAAIAAEAAARAMAEPQAAADSVGPLAAAAGAGDAKDTDRSDILKDFPCRDGGRPVDLGQPQTPARPTGVQERGRGIQARRLGTGHRASAAADAVHAGSELDAGLRPGPGRLRVPGQPRLRQFGSHPPMRGPARRQARRRPPRPGASRSPPRERRRNRLSMTSPGPPAEGYLVYATGTAYKQSTLASQVRGQLASFGSGSATTPASSASASAPTVSAGASAASSSVTGGSVPPVTLSGCVTAVTGGHAPRLVDKASYDGIPAYIIAVPTEVWVVGRGCTAADPQLITRVALEG